MSTVWHVLSLPVRALVWLADLALAVFQIGILLWLMVMGAIVLVLVGVRVSARLRAWRRVLDVVTTHPTPVERTAMADPVSPDPERDRRDALHDAFVLAAAGAPTSATSDGW